MKNYGFKIILMLVISLGGGQAQAMKKESQKPWRPTRMVGGLFGVLPSIRQKPYPISRVEALYDQMAEEPWRPTRMVGGLFGVPPSISQKPDPISRVEALKEKSEDPLPWVVDDEYLKIIGEQGRCMANRFAPLEYYCVQVLRLYDCVGCSYKLKKELHAMLKEFAAKLIAQAKSQRLQSFVSLGSYCDKLLEGEDCTAGNGEQQEKSCVTFKEMKDDCACLLSLYNDVYFNDEQKKELSAVLKKLMKTLNVLILKCS